MVNSARLPEQDMQVLSSRELETEIKGLQGNHSNGEEQNKISLLIAPC